MKKNLREVMQRIEFWPEERQENAAKMLLAIEAQIRGQVSLTEEQAAEVKRRVDDPAPRVLSLRAARSQFPK